MSTRLVKGQNTALTATRIRLTIDVSVPVDLSALLVGADGRVRSDADFAFYNQPRADGVVWSDTNGRQALDVDLAAVPANVDRILAVISLDRPGATFGELSPVGRLADQAGTDLGTFHVDGLGDERALIVWEVYRRATAWKVRAVGQGYAGGLGQLVTAYGVDVDDPEPVASPAASFGAQGAMPEPAPGGVRMAGFENDFFGTGTVGQVGGAPEFGPALDERLYDQIWKIFEDAARATAALRSATGYAEQRRENEMSAIMSDPAARTSPATSTKLAESEKKHDDLVARAKSDFKRDVGQLVAELAEVAQRLPAPMASWDSPTWANWRPAAHPQYAVRVGELAIPEAPELKIPMVFRLPMRTPLWIDSGDSKRAEATAVARALVVRLLAAYPPGDVKVHVADLVGSGAAAKGLEPLGGNVVASAATNPAQLAEMLSKLVERVDLIQMAVRADALDTLPDTVDTKRHLVVLYDFPYGFDDRAIAQLRYLIEEGPSVGVNMIFIADPDDATTLGPLVSSLWRSMLRLSAVPDDHIGDPWVGLTWTYTPETGSAGLAVDTVLTRLADRAR